jgi:cytochrome oxidase Cu insertion factor (SCO1/SenC/PrrC family)
VQGYASTQSGSPSEEDGCSVDTPREELGSTSAGKIAGIIALLLVHGTIATVSVGPAAAAPQGSPWGGNYFPNIPLVTQDGVIVRCYDDLIKNKIVVINFIYASCRDACPLETARLLQVQQWVGDRVGNDIFMYSITIDPKHDMPAVLKQYAEKFHVGTGWTFLSGKKQHIDLVRKKLGLYTQDSNGKRKDHTANLIIGNEATGQWIRHSSLENPQYPAAMIGDWLSNWPQRKVVQSYAAMPRLYPPEKWPYLFRARCAACHSLGKGEKPHMQATD